MDLFGPTDANGTFYVDVTDLVLADYAADGADPVSAFRLQVNEAAFIEDDLSHRYELTMPAAGFDGPQLLLTFVAGAVLGDMDCDGDVDFDDILSFVLGIEDPDGYEDMFGVPPTLKGDMDGDDDLDFDDIPGFVAAVSGGGPDSPLLGDMDCDGDVDFDYIDDFVLGIQDPQAYAATFGVPPTLKGDTDGDGDLDFDDIPGFVTEISEAGGGAQTVPEPCALLLAAIGFIGVGTYGARRRVV